jgi:hypothetical protein
MAETLASAINAPINPSFLNDGLQRLQGETDLRKRGKTAAELEPLARQEKSRADLEAAQLEAQAKRGQLEAEGKQLQQGLERKKSIFEEARQFVGKEPERTITAFNPEKGLELAALTAIMGSFAGSISGNAALSAMEGISNGYRLGQEDLYKREVEAYDSELNKFKNRIQQAEQIIKNSMSLEADQRGLGDIEIKKLDPLLNDGVILAKAKQGDTRGALEDIQKAKDLFDQIRVKEIEAGFKPQQIKTITILDPKDEKTPIIVDANRYTGLGKNDPAYIADAPPKGGKGEDGDKIRMTTEPEKLIRGAADSLVALQRIENRLADPRVAKEFDENRLFRTLLESPKEKYPIEKYLTESIFQSLPPDSQELFVLIAMARNDYYKQISGQAVTGSEGARNFFATLQPTDGAKTLIQKSKAQKPTFVDRIEMGIDAYKIPPSYVKRLQNLISKAKEDQETSQIGEQGGKQQKELSQENQEALNWANSNPDDPRAARIKQRLGVQ